MTRPMANAHEVASVAIPDSWRCPSCQANRVAERGHQHGRCPAILSIYRAEYEAGATLRALACMAGVDHARMRRDLIAVGTEMRPRNRRSFR